MQGRDGRRHEWQRGATHSLQLRGEGGRAIKTNMASPTDGPGQPARPARAAGASATRPPAGGRLASRRPQRPARERPHLHCTSRGHPQVSPPAVYGRSIAPCSARQAAVTVEAPPSPRTSRHTARTVRCRRLHRRSRNGPRRVHRPSRCARRHGGGLDNSMTVSSKRALKMVDRVRPQSKQQPTHAANGALSPQQCEFRQAQRRSQRRSLGAGPPVSAQPNTTATAPPLSTALG